MNLIQLKNVSCQFANGYYGLRDINLDIIEGEFLVIVGSNGSGKTSLCRVLNGLLPVSEGEVLLDGISVSDDLTKARQRIGVVFQNADHQIVGETVEADVSFGPENLKLGRTEIGERVASALQSVNLVSKREEHPYSLSGGEKRRLAIAGILAMKPQVLVLDEPFTNLDYPGSKLVLEQVIQLHRQNHTIVMVTHELEKVVTAADRLVVLQKGQLIAQGVPSEIVKEVESFGVREPCGSKLNLPFSEWPN